jgi:hypothetical protein
MIAMPGVNAPPRSLNAPLFNPNGGLCFFDRGIDRLS